MDCRHEHIASNSTSESPFYSNDIYPNIIEPYTEYDIGHANESCSPSISKLPDHKPQPHIPVKIPELQKRQLKNTQPVFTFQHPSPTYEYPPFRRVRQPQSALALAESKHPNPATHTQPALHLRATNAPNPLN